MILVVKDLLYILIGVGFTIAGIILAILGCLVIHEHFLAAVLDIGAGIFLAYTASRFALDALERLRKPK